MGWKIRKHSNQSAELIFGDLFGRHLIKIERSGFFSLRCLTRDLVQTVEMEKKVCYYAQFKESFRQIEKKDEIRVKTNISKTFSALWPGQFYDSRARKPGLILFFFIISYALEENRATNFSGRSRSRLLAVSPGKITRVICIDRNGKLELSLEF